MMTPLLCQHTKASSHHTHPNTPMSKQLFLLLQSSSQIPFGPDAWAPGSPVGTFKGRSALLGLKRKFHLSFYVRAEWIKNRQLYSHSCDLFTSLKQRENANRNNSTYQLCKRSQIFRPPRAVQQACLGPIRNARNFLIRTEIKMFPEFLQNSCEFSLFRTWICNFVNSNIIVEQIISFNGPKNGMESSLTDDYDSFCNLLFTFGLKGDASLIATAENNILRGSSVNHSRFSKRADLKPRWKIAS